MCEYRKECRIWVPDREASEQQRRKNMQVYKQENIQKIKSELNTLRLRYLNLLSKIFGLSEKLKEEKAKEYLHHGVGRRLEVIERCIENIFSIFPIEREKLLRHEELIDVAINLHAFFVNIFGLLDNLAWVLIHEKRLAGTIDKKKIGLFKKETKEKFPSKFRQYLDSGPIKIWHDQYLINYRDALSHRIPLYVPPQTLNTEQKKKVEQIENKITDCIRSQDFDVLDKLSNEQKNIGSICPFFIHALSENKYVVLHAQLIADFNTIEKIVEKYCETFLG